MKMTGAQAIVQSLISEGVQILFGYPGGAIMPTYDALFDVQNILRHILVRHEQGAIHAAEGYARLAGKAGVCLVTSGPGATNLITGLADAMLDSIPIVCITGQVPSGVLGSNAFQETDIVSMTLPVTKWNYQITSAEEIPSIIAKAFHIAQSGRPGPVLLDITKDAQFGSFERGSEEYSSKAYQKTLRSKSLPNSLNGEMNLKINYAVNLINRAKRPYLLAGHGVLLAKAEQELLEFAEKTQTPVACTLLGLSAFPTEHPLYAGMLGMHGNYGANILTNEADLIIAVGMRFDDRVTGNLATYAKQAKIIHIEIDQSEINKNVLVDLALLMDAKAALKRLVAGVKENKHEEWLNQFRENYNTEYEKVIAEELYPNSGQIKMAEVIHRLSEKTNGEAILVTDVGQHQMIAARYYRFKNTNSHITSGGLGTMGFALPAAIGAKVASPDREVIAVIGDGGFQMNIQELAVLMQERIRLKIVVLNNSNLGMVRQWQELFFDRRYSFSELKNPDFIKIAEGYGIQSRRVTNREELCESLEAMLCSDQPYLLEVVVEKQENVFPMIPTGYGVGEMKLGFK